MIIKNGLVAMPGDDRPQLIDLRIEKGKISVFGPDLNDDRDCIDAEGLLVLPGGIDPHVHFDDPGYTEREDFYCGCSAAASGGITTVIDMPCTSIPPVTDLETLERKLEVIKSKAVVDYGLFGGISLQSFEENFPRSMVELSPYVLGFKTYFISGMESFERLNLFQFETVLEKACELDVPILLHAEDYHYVAAATKVARMKGATPRDYYLSRPETAEIIAVSNAVFLAEEIGSPLHIVHLGSARAAEYLQPSNVTGETCPHYLAFELDDFEIIGSPLKVAPSIKSKGNREKLWELLAEGVIDYVASDHAPCPDYEKQTGSIWDDYSGIPGTGTLLPYMFSEGYTKGRLSLTQFIDIVSGNAAKRFGLTDRKGSIRIGLDADLVLIDPNRDWTVDGRKFLSKGKMTPFQGMSFTGAVTKTIVRGEIVYDWQNSVVVEPGYGNWIRRNPGL